MDILKNNSPQQNTMAACLRFIIAGAACCACYAAAGPECPAGISGDVLAFVDNIEYSTRYRTGETLFGASAVVRFYYEPSEHIRFAAGVYGLRRFGDERFFSRTLPVFRARYVSDNLSFILGELVSAEAHGLPDVLYRQEYRYDPGIEEGIQFMGRRGCFSTDLWVSWDSLNTPAHREHFIAGNSSMFSFDEISIPFFIISDHTGGELYNIQSQPVQEHFGGAAGINVTHPLHAGSALRRVFGQVLALGSTYRVRSGNGEAGRGYGIMCKAGISPFGFDCSAQWFKGRDLFLPTGDPLFRSDKPVYAFEAARDVPLKGGVSVRGGLRFETEGCSLKTYFSNPRYRWWITMNSGFERKFRH
jgi:hypothetical protein